MLELKFDLIHNIWQTPDVFGFRAQTLWKRLEKNKTFKIERYISNWAWVLRWAHLSVPILTFKNSTEADNTKKQLG